MKIKVKSIYDWLLWGGILLLFGQLLVLGYMNLTQVKYHLGFDASCFYLKALEMAKQGTVFVENWGNQTTLYLDSSVPLAALIYLFTKNIFFSYGFVNCLVILAIMWVLNSILVSLKISKVARVLCLNLVLCPYIKPEFETYNNCDYFSCMLSDAQFYGTKMLIILMVLKMVMDLEDNKKNYGYVFITELLLFISGMSGGWHIVVSVIAPLIVFYLIKMFIRNSFSEFLNRKSLLLILGGMLTAIGKQMTVILFHFESKDSAMTLVGFDEFWENIGSILLGWIDFFGALGYESSQSVFEIRGIIHLLSLAVCLLFIIAMLVITVRVCKSFYENDKYGMLVTCVTFNILMFIFVNVRDGAEIFQVRYLMPIYLFTICLVGGLLEILDNHLILKKIGIVTILGILSVLNIYGDRKYLKTKNDYDVLCEVVDEINELDTKVVYVYGDDYKLTAYDLRVVDESRIYKYIYRNCFNDTIHWGDYIYYDDIAEVQNRNVLVTSVEDFETLPEYIRRQYQIDDQIGRYSVYVANVNKFDLVSGATEDINLDYPTSADLILEAGELDQDGSYVSDGSENVIITGPYTRIKKGIYDFTINYEIIESTNNSAEFSISINHNQDVLGSVILSEGEKTATIHNVEVPEDSDGFGYNVYNQEGTIIRIDSFEIRRK